MTDSDFQENYITEKDKLFLKSLLRESSSSNELLFSHLKGTTKASGFLSKEKYLPNVTIFKNTNMILTSITTEYSFDKLLYTMVPFFQKIKLHNIKNFNVFDEISIEDLKKNVIFF
jgi:hypothetical protein